MTEEFTDAIALLKADHRKVEGLFDKYKNSSGKPFPRMGKVPQSAEGLRPTTSG